MLHAGARPVFVDVRDDDFNIDAAQIEAAITPRTRAIIAVHLYGQMCDIDAVAAICERHGLVLIEDAAQAVGASIGGKRAGAFGTGCFSFYATKNLHDRRRRHDHDERRRRRRARADLRSQGERTRYVTEELGYNYRMTEIAAALGHAQLPKLDARNERAARTPRASANCCASNEASSRRANCRGGATSGTSTRSACAPAATRATACRRALRERGIESAVFYPTPIHHQPLYQRLGYGDVESARRASAWPTRCCRCRCTRRCRRRMSRRSPPR